MKYHSVTYMGPLERAMGVRKFAATRANPTKAMGSIQKGVSPHSTPWASPIKIPTAVAQTTICQARKMK